jgi:hypothetical protein
MKNCKFSRLSTTGHWRADRAIWIGVRTATCTFSPVWALFSWLIIRIFQLVFSDGTVFFSHKKSAETVFQLIFQHK